jgi:hypothetical protein
MGKPVFCKRSQNSIDAHLVDLPAAINDEPMNFGSSEGSV